jgi:hypothetical protein
VEDKPLRRVAHYITSSTNSVATSVYLLATVAGKLKPIIALRIRKMTDTVSGEAKSGDQFETC